MPLVPISALDDPRVAVFRHLKDTNLTRWSETFVVEGDKLVDRLLASDFEVVSLLASERYAAPLTARVASDLPVYVMPQAAIEQLIGFNFHRGVLACARRRPNADLIALCSPLSRPLTLAICPDVQDPENLGAIVRIASALGADGVVLGKRSGDPFSRRVLRVSMGTVLQMPLVVSRDIVATLGELREHCGVELWATVLAADAEPLGDASRPPRLAMLFGSEGHGLEPRVIAECNRRVIIPMRPGVDSLNVAVAAGIFLHHVLRR